MHAPKLEVFQVILTRVVGQGMTKVLSHCLRPTVLASLNYKSLSESQVTFADIKYMNEKKWIGKTAQLLWASRL